MCINLCINCAPITLRFFNYENNQLGYWSLADNLSFTRKYLHYLPHWWQMIENADIFLCFFKPIQRESF